MKDIEIDEILERGAGVPYQMDPTLRSRVSASMTDVQPVRPVSPVWMVASLLSISALIAIASASALGLYGITKLSGVEIATIFSALGMFTWLTAMASVGEMIPGSRKWMNPVMLLALILIGSIAVDAILFRDYAMGAFVPAGIPCLRAGLAVAIPAGIGSWLVLRRGFAVNHRSAGLAAGTLAGLAGVTMLEFHCPNFLAPHVIVWHTAVIPISALVGARIAKPPR
jgi:Negative regulator of sigma F